jgi:hypothetical protein
MITKLKTAWFKMTHWEQWHYNVKYAFLSPVWLWYSLRARSFYFFAPANPGLTFGGFEGGTKKEIYDQLPKECYPNSIYIQANAQPDNILKVMAKNNLSFPVAVKPNIGMMGLMFRKIDDHAQLLTYHETITVEYIIQELIEYPIEVSVFYYRMPGSKKGVITGFVRKEALEVTGDGKSTLEVLMEQLRSRPGFTYDEWKNKHKTRLNDVIPEGEIFKLSWVSNLSRGARLISLQNEKDHKLLQIFDNLSHSSTLYYGRYDIKCTSIDDLTEGRNFSIIEFNGTGAEPHHVYGNNYNFYNAAKIIIHHWNVLFLIARDNNRQGVKYPTLKEGLMFTKRANRHFKHLRELDKRMPVFH